MPTLAFLVLAGAGVGVARCETARRKREPIEVTHRWVLAPRVLRCPDAQVTLEYVQDAMQWVERMGGRWAGDASDDACATGRPGSLDVYVRGPGPIGGTGYGGLTELSVFGELALYGTVWLQPVALTDELVLRHELLHVQGLEHVAYSGHIMSSSIDTAGESTWGVREALRLAWE